ncbi:MAG: PmoA family protein [Planctomycetaceae bacterium]|jgi:hypothetical protein|nr:PmoA family protein [Planctomycetaceae bacterium]
MFFKNLFCVVCLFFCFLICCNFCCEVFAEGLFQFKEESGKRLVLTDGKLPVLVYCFDVVEHEKVPKKDLRRAAGCYVHPLYGIDGEELTDNAPVDHFHHHGVFWTWPHVGVHNEDGKIKNYDLWTSNTTLKQHFVRWIDRQTLPDSAFFEVENGWFVGEPVDKNKIMSERVKIIVHRIKVDKNNDGKDKVKGKDEDDVKGKDEGKGKDESEGLKSRAVDIQIVLKPVKPISLRGSEGKSYGGLSIRFKPYIPENERGKKNVAAKQSDFNIITTPQGTAKSDLPQTPLAWADYTSKFGGRDTYCGAAIFIPKAHPDYPPTWLTRYYGPLCVGWPGVKERTFQPNEEIKLNYRIWIHNKKVTTQQIKKYYNEM